MLLHGTVLLLLADTMAAHQLCGFKVGVGRALRKCRDCNATFDLVQTKVMIYKFGLFTVISVYFLLVYGRRIYTSNTILL